MFIDFAVNVTDAKGSQGNDDPSVDDLVRVTITVTDSGEAVPYLRVLPASTTLE